MLIRIVQTRQYPPHTLPPSVKLSSVLFLFLFFSSLVTRPLEATYAFMYGACSQEKYQQDSGFESNLNSLFSSIVSSASQVSYNAFATGNGSSAAPQDARVYGLYQCRGDLKMSDCSGCIQSLVGQISLVCPYSFEASLQLEGCYLRYDRIDFLGKLDTTVMYKRCSKSLKSDDPDFLKRRDDVLADLQSAVGFRVSSSGSVQGFAQCLGDLSQDECPSCLAEAVGKLKSLCGSAAAASVFLGQCYARYWDAGYSDMNSASDDTNKDDVGKTVAIIVGIIGGLAIFIVLLSVCRRSMGRY